MKPEDSHQIALANYLSLLRLDWCHVPNGGYRNAREGAKFKRMGVKAGIPDILIFNKPHVVRGLDRPEPYVDWWRGMAIELKAGKNKPTKEQKQWLKKLSRHEWLCHVSYSIDQSIFLVKKYYSHLM